MLVSIAEELHRVSDIQCTKNGLCACTRKIKRDLFFSQWLFQLLCAMGKSFHSFSSDRFYYTMNVSRPTTSSHGIGSKKTSNCIFFEFDRVKIETNKCESWNAQTFLWRHLLCTKYSNNIIIYKILQYLVDAEINKIHQKVAHLYTHSHKMKF